MTRHDFMFAFLGGALMGVGVGMQPMNPGFIVAGALVVACGCLSIVIEVLRR